jgi:hypothetical protein
LGFELAAEWPCVHEILPKLKTEKPKLDDGSSVLYV